LTARHQEQRAARSGSGEPGEVPCCHRLRNPHLL
jgi:hypothetical protein